MAADFRLRPLPVKPPAAGSAARESGTGKAAQAKLARRTLPRLPCGPEDPAPATVWQG
jgi:hypothetical protein